MLKPRYRLMLSVAINEDLVVVIEAKHRTKATLREAYALAKGFVRDGTVKEIRACDTTKEKDLAMFHSSVDAKQANADVDASHAGK